MNTEKQSRTIEDYSRFCPASYLAEYCGGVTHEIKFLLRFYHDAYGAIGKADRMLELGGGPTINQLISASRAVSTIIFSDFLEVNRVEVAKWLVNNPNAFDWDRHFEFVARMEAEPSAEPTIAMKERLRQRIVEVIHCDLTSDQPIAGSAYSEFDIVSSAFCIECIDNDEHKFRRFFSRATSLIVPGGYIVLAMLKDCQAYSIGDYFFPAFPVNERFMESWLLDEGFGEIRMRSDVCGGGQGYSGIMGITARKKRTN